MPSFSSTSNLCWRLSCVSCVSFLLSEGAVLVVLHDDIALAFAELHLLFEGGAEGVQGVAAGNGLESLR